MGRCLVAALVAVLGFGCTQPVGDPAGLSKTEIQFLLKCQDAVLDQGRQFLTVKLDSVESCLQKALKVQLEYADGHLSPEKYAEKLEAIRQDCLRQFAHVGRQSTRLVDAIILACQGVEHLIFTDYNPLQFAGLEVFPLVVTDVETLAAAICVGKELMADFSLFFQIPRAGPAAGSDGNSFSLTGGLFDILGLDPFDDIPLDPRCLVVT